MKLENINRITFFNILSTVVLQGLSFISSPIFSRLLGTENYGIVSVYVTWVSIVSIVFSLQTSSTLAVARNEYSVEEQPKYQSSVLSLSTSCYAILSLIIIVLISSVSSILQMPKMMMFLLLIQGFGQFCVTFINTKFTYEFKADRNCFIAITTSVLSIGLSLLLIPSFPKSVNYWGRILGLAITYLILGISIFSYIIIKGKTFYNKRYWKFCILLALPIIFHNLSNILLGQSDRVMLQQLGTNTMVGIYSLASGFSSVLSTIWNALNNSWVPFYYEYTRLDKINILKKRATYYIELFTILAVGFILLAPEVYHIYAGSEYWSGTSIITILAIGYYMTFLYSFPVNFEFFHKKTSIIALGTISAALCNIILNYFMILQWGPIGAAIATAISHGLQFLFHLLFVKTIGKKFGNYPFSFNLFLPYILVFFIIGVGTSLLVDSWYIRWGIGIILGIWELYRIIKRKAIF